MNANSCRGHRRNQHVRNKSGICRRVSIWPVAGATADVGHLRYKKSGEFDRLRREILSHLQRSVSFCSLLRLKE